MNENTRNLTEGSVLKNIVYFSLPFLLSYFLQTLYGMADLFIIGQFNGTSQITAVSIGSQVMHMITVIIVGLAMGTTVKIGQAVGAGKKDEVSTVIGNTITMFMLVALALALVLLVSVNGIINIISTPKEAIEGTRQYLSVCFIGIPFIVAYNIISSIFRGLGDSKRPMYFVAVACVINIVLDYVFIGIFGLGAMGAALGTTIAQATSVVISIVIMLKKNVGIKLNKSHFKIKSDIAGAIIKVGIPVALQDGFIQVSFIIITAIANQRGLVDAAAVGIVEKIIGILFLIPSSMLSSVSAIAAQNIGAGKYERADKTLKYSIIICVIFGTVVSILMQFIAEPVVALFDKSEAVKIAGGQYLKGYAPDCLFAGIHFCFSGYFCAHGKSGISFLHNVLAIVLVRVPGAFLMSKLYADTLLPMGLATVCGSILSSIICVIAFIIIRNVPQKIQK